MIDLLGTKKRTVENAVLPLATLEALRRKHPDLSADECTLVAEGLRQWYRVAQLAGGRPVAMPSTIVDELWHEHIVCTRDYLTFCQKAFSRFLHHQPEAAMSTAGVAANRGPYLRTTWDLAMRAAGSELTPYDLPLLFGIDERLGVEGGKRYVYACGSDPCSSGFATCYWHLPQLRRNRNGRSSWSNSDGTTSYVDGGSSSCGTGSGGAGCGGSSGCGSGSSSCGGGGGGCGGSS